MEKFMDSAVLFLHARGQLADEIRMLDWNSNPVGTPEYWPVQSP